MKIEKQIRKLYKRFANAALSLGTVYHPQPDTLYVVLYKGQKPTRVKVTITIDPPEGGNT